MIKFNSVSILVTIFFTLPVLHQKSVAAEQVIKNNTLFSNSAGSVATYSTQGKIDKNNLFFQSLGTNGRSCVTCHQPENGWSVTPNDIQKRFNATSGKDALFRINDGSNSINANVSTLSARRNAYSLLLKKGVFRIERNLPKEVEFELTEVKSPYEKLTNLKNTSLAFFRRPLPATNLKFLSNVMWDGRETTATTQNVFESLANQANSATTGHAEGNVLLETQNQEIVDFETALFTTQVIDKKAKALTDSGEDLTNLSTQEFYVGINDFIKDSQTGAVHNPDVFDLYDKWNGLIKTKPNDIKAAIARGQQIFNTKPITISGVSGLNNTVEFENKDVVTGTCSTCHNTPNVGNHSVNRFFNIGISNADQRTADMPLYTLKNKTTGEIITTTDLGRGAITGKWEDIGRFKVPILRGLASRPPYFHNGMAAEIGNVLDFYDRRFHIGFDNRERLDLILFLQTL